VSGDRLSYAAITPARDEVDGIGRLAPCLVDQTQRPVAWIVVDNGSTDGTGAAARSLAREFPWISVIDAPASGRAEPGAPVVRAFHAGLDALESLPDVVVKLDADVSVDGDYFERLVGAFARDASLGIASGVCYEREPESREWRPTHTTASAVRGATRAYRRQCLEQILPLEEGMGWDGTDELKAQARGWRTGQIGDLAFYHHRRVGERDGGRHRRWVAQGRGSRAMGYRFSYLALRAAFHARRDPAALAMLYGYLEAAARRAPRVDPQARAFLRERQRLRNAPARLREALGRAGAE
jgi:glycosyltransferase involved in cell wall biosynthesis